MTIYFGISCKYHFQVCNFTMIRINNIWMTSPLHKSKQTNIESSIGTAVEHSPNLYLKAMAGWYKGKNLLMQLANISIMSFPTSCSTHFQSLPHSRASQNCISLSNTFLLPPKQICTWFLFFLWAGLPYHYIHGLVT